MPIHSWSFWLSVHPRARGVHMVSEQFRICLGGSSPRSRGTRHLGIPPAGRPRFIPALAGNTSPKVHPSVRSAVHPRARGEHGAILSLNGKTVFTINWKRPNPSANLKEPVDADIFAVDGQFYLDAYGRQMRRAMAAHARPDSYLAATGTLAEALASAEALIPHLPR